MVKKRSKSLFFRKKNDLKRIKDVVKEKTKEKKSKPKKQIKDKKLIKNDKKVKKTGLKSEKNISLKNKKNKKPLNSNLLNLEKSKSKSNGQLNTTQILNKYNGDGRNQIKKACGEGYLCTHVPGFDKLIKGPGMPEGSAILVEGGPGSGKTIFCLSLLKEACERGKKVLYMSFEEREERLIKHIDSFGGNAKEYIKKGKLYVKRFNALDIARSVEALLSEAKKELLIDVQPVLIPKEFQPDIVLIDSLTSIGSAFSGEESRFRVYMEQLFRYLESHEITSFLIREVSSPTHVGNVFSEKGAAVSFLSDGIIALYNVFHNEGHRKRGIEIVKLRGMDIDRKIVEMDILGKQGAVVYPNKVIKGNYKLT